MPALIRARGATLSPSTLLGRAARAGGNPPADALHTEDGQPILTEDGQFIRVEGLPLFLIALDGAFLIALDGARLVA